MIRPIPIRAATAAPSRLVVSSHASRASSLFPSFTTTRTLATETTTSTPQTLSPRSPFRSQAPPAALTPHSPAPKQLTYHVERTPSKNLPVYDDVRSGGTRKQTLIKKIVGSAQDLKNDIMEELKLKKDDIKVNPVTGQIVIKGFHHQKVKNWLEARGF